MGLDLTSVELVLLATLLAGASTVLGGRRRPSLDRPTILPAVLALAAMLASSWLAAGHTGEALRFCGRFGAGLMLCVLVTNTITSNRLLTLIRVMSLSGTVVAALGIMEYYQPSLLSEWLGNFKTHPVYIGGHLRVSSTLQYPTITSMYLEITFGLGLGLLLYAAARSRVRLMILVFVCLLITLEGILVTQTRSGLLMVFVQLTVVGGLYWIRNGRNRGVLVLARLAFCVVVLLGHMVVFDPIYLLRLTSMSQEGWYRAAFEVPQTLSLTTGEYREVPVKVTNKDGLPGPARATLLSIFLTIGCTTTLRRR